MVERKNYNRTAAVAYAKKWALSINKCYGDFEDIGGNCTNYISQCLFAGSQVMNFSPTDGWYYVSFKDRTPSWTSVELLYEFLISNTTRGVFGYVVPVDKVEIGDVIQFQDKSGDFYHSVFVTQTGLRPAPNNILVCSHSMNAYQKRLSSYDYYQIRCIHISGYYQDNVYE